MFHNLIAQTLIALSVANDLWSLGTIIDYQSEDGFGRCSIPGSTIPSTASLYPWDKPDQGVSKMQTKQKPSPLGSELLTSCTRGSRPCRFATGKQHDPDSSPGYKTLSENAFGRYGLPDRTIARAASLIQVHCRAKREHLKRFSG